MLEAALARVSILEKRRDICYQNAFKDAGEGGCIVRGCGTKWSLSKNGSRHFKSTKTPEHEVAAILLQQTECLPCGKHWKTSLGLDHREQKVHQETRLSRMDTFQQYLEQPLACIHERPSTQSLPPAPDNLQPNVSYQDRPSWSISNVFAPFADSTPADPPQHPPQPGAASLPLQMSNGSQPNWSSSNVFQPWQEDTSAYPSTQPLQQGLDSPSHSTYAPLQSGWPQSGYSQRSAAAATGDHSTQLPPSDFVFPQPSCHGSNESFHPGY